MNKFATTALIGALALLAGAAGAQDQRYGDRDRDGAQDQRYGDRDRDRDGAQDQRYGDRDRDGDRRGGRITLYELPNFQGRSVTVDRDDPSLVPEGFNDRARSVRVVGGAWSLCEHVDFKGRCELVRQDIRDLASIRMDRLASSVREERGNSGGGGWPGSGGWGSQDGVQGRSVVFYRRPNVNGEDIAGSQLMANLFCRFQGHGQAVYFDAQERGRRARGDNGRLMNDTPVLRDVVCRKR